jgi:hypothetical protein
MFELLHKLQESLPVSNSMERPPEISADIHRNLNSGHEV